MFQYLFKNDNKSFLEMQTQLYLFGTVSSWLLYVGEHYASGDIQYCVHNEKEGTFCKLRNVSLNQLVV